MQYCRHDPNASQSNGAQPMPSPVLGPALDGSAQPASQPASQTASQPAKRVICSNNSRHTVATQSPHSRHTVATVKNRDFLNIHYQGYKLQSLETGTSSKYRFFTVATVWRLCGDCVATVWRLSATQQDASHPSPLRDSLALPSDVTPLAWVPPSCRAIPDPVTTYYHLVHITHNITYNPILSSVRGYLRLHMLITGYVRLAPSHKPAAARTR